MTTAKSKTILTMALNKETETRNDIPMPDDFEQYIPYAYCELQGDTRLMITRMKQNEYINIGQSERSKKNKRSKAMPPQSSVDVEKSASWKIKNPTVDKVTKILVTYDYADNLVKITLDKNPAIPRKLMKLISLIIPYHANLTALTINQGLDMYILHELNSWLSISNITDVCLDDTFLKEANYHILLETQNYMKNLSLARCRIDDVVIKNITSKLIYPLPASKTLQLLNLASNRITDEGAMYLGEVLRSNRKLYYLNLADNMITDDGTAKILSVLVEFPVMKNEVLAMRYNLMFYLKEKCELSKRILKDLKSGEYEKKLLRRKSAKTPQTVAKKVKGFESAKGLVEGTTRSLVNLEGALRDKAGIMALNMLGQFDGPFYTTHTVLRDGITYCLGNNVLCYLNLAYNNLSYVSVKRLLDVLRTQKEYDRCPRGLVNVCIEGNNIPMSCAELANIDEILVSALTASSRMSMRRKPSARSPAK